ncbi:hypothetical protein L0128_00635 [candidate division KSB1 bacterium]|nr:hypothetical protein [candidate division KSB1 bacterium]
MRFQHTTTQLSLLILWLLGLAGVSHAQTRVDSSQFQPIGYVDANRDGINDRFVDANGDGINDLTQQSYRHSFQFEDKNQDGINDIWVDGDGDGVNDLLVICLKKQGIRPQIEWLDHDGDGILDTEAQPSFKADLRQFVVDEDGDGKNDITGLKVENTNVLGFRYGRIDEELNLELKKFQDKNGDGMYDQLESRLAQIMKKGNRMRPHDLFIDRDGDGLADDRGFGGMGKSQNRRQRGKRK